MDCPPGMLGSFTGCIEYQNWLVPNVNKIKTLQKYDLGSTLADRIKTRDVELTFSIFSGMKVEN